MKFAAPNTNIVVVADFESVIFLVERDKVIQDVHELQISKALAGYGGGKVFGRNKAEGGKEEKDEEAKERQVAKDAIHAVLPAGSVLSLQQTTIYQK